MLVYLEELKNLKETVRNVAKELTGVKSAEAPPTLGKVFKEGFTVNKTINGFTSYLSHEVSSIDKESLVFLVSSFLEGLTSYIVEWNSFFEKCATGCSLDPGDLYHLLAIAIADIAELLVHCKESINIYEKCFHEVSSYLSNLFKSSYHILKVILDILNKAYLEQCGTNDISKYGKCIMQLFDVSLVLNDIDMMPLGNTLRCLNRIICGKGDLINDELDGNLMFKVVCTCILDKLTFSWSMIKESSQQVDSKRLSTVTKLLRFLFGMLLRLIKHYKNEIFGDATRYVISVLMSLQWMAPKSVHEELDNSPCYKEFCDAILIVIEPLLMELIDERDFIARFQTPKEFMSGNDESARHDLSALQLTVAIACCLVKAKGETKDEWMNELAPSSRHSLVDLAFHLYERCQEQSLSSVMVPMAVEVDQNPRNIPLHEYVCIGLCAFASTLSQQNYVKLERCLLKNLMFSSKSTFVLAADVVSFIARWGTDDLCLHLTSFFAQLSSSLFKNVSLQSELLNRGLQMMRRLYLLLGDSKQDDFLKNCMSSIKDYIPIWIYFPFESLDERTFRKYVDLIVASTLKVLEETKDNDPQKKFMVVKVWENCLKRKNALECLNPTHLNGIVEVITDTFLSMEKSDCEKVDEELICCVLGVTSHVVHALNHIKEILNVAAVLLQCNSSSNMPFKVCQLLSALKSVHFETEHKEFCLSNVSTMFSKLLAHQSFFVRFEAMKSLRAFAEVTKHPEVVADCLPASATEKFTDFLNNVRFLDDMTLSSKNGCLKRALTMTSEAISKKQLLSEEEGEDIATNPKFDSCSEASSAKELQVIEKEFKSAVEAITDYWQARRIPEQVLKRLQTMAKTVEQLGTV